MAHLSFEERHYIEFQIRDGVSQNAISRKLGRSQATISRELARNTGQRGYRHKQADRMAQERHQTKPKSVKLTDDIIRRIETDIRAAIPHAYTTSVTAYKKHHTQGAATAAYVLRYVIFPKNSTIYHEHTKYIRLRTLVIPRGLMKRGELLISVRTGVLNKLLVDWKKKA